MRLVIEHRLQHGTEKDIQIERHAELNDPLVTVEAMPTCMQAVCIVYTMFTYVAYINAYKDARIL